MSDRKDYKLYRVRVPDPDGEEQTLSGLRSDYATHLYFVQPPTRR